MIKVPYEKACFSLLIFGALCVFLMFILGFIFMEILSMTSVVLVLLIALMIFWLVALQANETFQEHPNHSVKALTQDQSTQDKSADEMWRSYDFRAVKHYHRIALTASDNAEGRAIASDLAELGHEVHHCNLPGAVLDTVTARPEFWDFVIVDMDLATEVEDAVDDLLTFRQSCPTICVLLLSSSVLCHDFSGERAAIGDATLRKPVVKQQLAKGIVAALANFEHRRPGLRVRQSN